MMLVLSVDADLAGHVGVALRRHRDALQKNGLAEPPGLADLESAVLEVTKRQRATQSDSVTRAPDDGLDEREYLTRNDISRLAAVSVRTVDRWLTTGLPSHRRGRIRRVARSDLARFLHAA